MINTLRELLNGKIAVAILGKTHGLKGELKLHPFTNFPEIIESLEEIFLYNEKTKQFMVATVENLRLADGYYIIKLNGVENVENARKFVGSKVYINKDELPNLSKDEYYFFEIVGSQVIDESGKVLGVVDEVIQTGSNDVIVVNKNKEDEILIPVIYDYIITLDKENKKIVVKVPEWLD